MFRCEPHGHAAIFGSLGLGHFWTSYSKVNFSSIILTDYKHSPGILDEIEIARSHGEDLCSTDNRDSDDEGVDEDRGTWSEAEEDLSSDETNSKRD